MVFEAEEDGDEVAAQIFSQARDVEAFHADLYKRALNHLIAQRATKYHVCTICGYIAETTHPEKCPVCGATPIKFVEVK